MLTIIAQFVGVAGFVAGTMVLGVRLRRQPGRLAAREALRASHVLSVGCLLLPWLAGIVYPGLARYDALLGFSPLPFRPFMVLAGCVMVLAGLYLAVGARRRLSERRGTAFYAGHSMPRGGLYRRVRNPLSLGCYLGGLGAGLLAGSTVVTLGTLLVIIPSHLFHLLFFEEPARTALYGSAYVAYRRRVPFLIPRLHLPRG